MMLKKEQEVVLITDGANGIGRVTCEYLRSKGYQVYATSGEKDSKTALPYPLLPIDLSSTLSVKKCIKKILTEAGKIDILINNSGYSERGSLINISLEDMIKQYNINVFGAMRMIQGVVPCMLEQGCGRIINVGSIGGRLPIPFQAAYSSSNAALMNLTDSLKIELLNQGIKVCLIEPGNMLSATAQGEKNLPPQLIAEVIWKAMTSNNPKQRYVVGSEATLVDKFNRVLPSFLRRKLVINMFKNEESANDSPDN